MELSAILDALEGSETTTKTASASEITASHRLESALDDALSMDKTASVYSNNANSPSEDLVKIAQRLADAEQLALVKEAEMYGAAVCDGFLSRMNEHESNGVKVASFGGGADVDEVLLKQAMELGYRETQQQLEKVASEAFAQGYNDTLNQSSDQAEAEKLASLALRQGYNDTMQAINHAGQEKRAQDTMMIKQAAETKAQQGYDHANRILASLLG